MDKEKLEYFRGLLRQQLDELISEAEKTLVTMTDKEENFPDPNDRASLESDRNFLLRIRERERKLILKIKEALKRLDDETFGVCEICGGEITEERLRVRPVTTQCIECKMLEEAKEKAKEKARMM